MTNQMPFHPRDWRFYAAYKIMNQDEGVFIYWAMTLWS
jgi:hypothetical protein